MSDKMRNAFLLMLSATSPGEIVAARDALVPDLVNFVRKRITEDNVRDPTVLLWDLRESSFAWRLTEGRADILVAEKRAYVVVAEALGGH